MIYTFIKIVNIILLGMMGIILLEIMFNYIDYKEVFNKSYKYIFYKNIENKFKWFYPKEDSDSYKKINSILRKSGLNISVRKYILCKIFLILILFIIAINVYISSNNYKISLIIADMSTYNKNYKIYDINIKEDIKINNEKILCKSTEKYFNKIKNDINIKSKVKQYIKQEILRKKYRLYGDSEDINFRIINKVDKIIKLKTDSTIMSILFLIGIFTYYIPDFLCIIYQILIEDKRSWETIISIYTYNIFSRIPPYKTSYIIENICETSEVNRPIFSRIKYGFEHGRGIEFIDKILKSTELDDDMVELLETLKLTMTIGVEKTVCNIESLASNVIEWKKIEQGNKKNKKYLLIIPILIIIFLVGFDYLMYGFIEVMNNIKITF